MPVMTEYVAIALQTLHHAAHLWLGMALALSPICAWLAMRGEQVILQPADLGRLFD